MSFKPETLQYFKEKLEQGQELTQKEILVVIKELIDLVSADAALDTRLTDAEATILDHEDRIATLEP